MSNELQAPKRYQCRHILTGGRRCAGPALKGEQLCYHHHTIRQPIDPIALRDRRARTVNFELPNPEDHTAIQHSLGEILSRLASHDLDHRRAGVMLYCLHIATRNLKENQPKSTEQEEEGEIVEEIVHDPILGDLAPVTEIVRKKSFAAALLQELTYDSNLNAAREAVATAKQETETARQELEAARNELEAAKLELEAARNNNPPQPTTLPTLQAVATTLRVPHPQVPTGARGERTFSLGWQPTGGEATPSTSASSTQTQKRHFDRRRCTCRRSGETRFSTSAVQSSRPQAAHPSILMRCNLARKATRPHPPSPRHKYFATGG